MNWISVDDRLPENDDRVIILSTISDYGYPYIYNEAVEVGFYSEGSWYSDTRFEARELSIDNETFWAFVNSDEPYKLWGNVEVTHWMPLPEMPDPMEAYIEGRNN